MWSKGVYKTICWGESMNRRDLKNFSNIEELWNEEMQEELSYIYSSDVMENFKDK
jgi:hypothetical protein